MGYAGGGSVVFTAGLKWTSISSSSSIVGSGTSSTAGSGTASLFNLAASFSFISFGDRFHCHVVKFP